MQAQGFFYGDRVSTELESAFVELGPAGKVRSIAFFFWEVPAVRTVAGLVVTEDDDTIADTDQVRTPAVAELV